MVPSKFFGSLASGRPVIFAGARHAAIVRWIEQYQVGWVLDAGTEPRIAAELRNLAAAPDRLKALQRHCHEVYQKHFSRERVMSAWDRELHELLR